MEKHAKEKLKVYGYDIYRSLGRSDVRARVLASINRAGGRTTIAEISEYTGISYTNVKRAVYGQEHIYRKNLSLISTGLVTEETINDTDIKIIALTGKGREVVKTLEEPWKK